MSKPTKLEANEVLQQVVRKTGEEYKLSTTTEISGMAEVEIDAVQGDNVALADADTGVKAKVNNNQELLTHDLTVKNAVVDLMNKIQLKPLEDYDNVSNTLSGAGTIETYVFKMGSTTVATAVITYDDATRARWNNLVWS